MAGTGAGSPRSTRRRGVAAMEFAVCLPLIVLLVAGSIELSHVIYLKQSLTAVAYEAAREAVRSEATPTSVQRAADQILIGHRVRSGSVRISPNLAIPRGQRLTVTVSAPITDNRVIVPRYVAGINLTASASMVKE